MPRYSLAALNLDGRLEDLRGTELPDDAAAREYAIRVIRELQREEEDHWRGWTMDVTQADRRASILGPWQSSRRRSREYGLLCEVHTIASQVLMLLAIWEDTERQFVSHRTLPPSGGVPAYSRYKMMGSPCCTLGVASERALTGVSAPVGFGGCSRGGPSGSATELTRGGDRILRPRESIAAPSC
jgi:hypothetical protein